jgi:hypothetical protein
VLKRLDHQLQALVGSPFAESQNAMLGIAPPGEVWILRLSREDSVRAKMNVIATILFVEDLAITGHEHGNGVRQKKHLGGGGAKQAIGARVAHSSVFQIHSVHQVVQGDVGIAAGETREQWRE